MTPWDDPWDVDESAEWTDLDVERLIRGASGDEVPHGLGDTAALLRTARGPAEGDEIGDRIGAATALASTTAVLAPSGGAPWWRAPRWIAVAAISAVLVTSGVAAAATHGLTSGSSGPASQNNSTIDATRSSDAAPETSAAPSTSAPETSTSSPTTVESGEPNGVGPLVVGPALHGLCTAFADRSEQPGSSVAFRNLAEAAAAAHQAIQELCAAVLSPPSGNQGQGNGPPATVNAPGHHDAAPPGQAKDRGHGNGHGHGEGD